MKILVGVSSHGSAKDYTHKKFRENMEVCVAPFADVMTFGDREIAGITHVSLPSVHSVWQDSMTYQSRDEIRQYTKDNNYDAFIWQGVDCYYNSKKDFENFIDQSLLSNFSAVGALTAGRNRPDYAVARRFEKLGLGQVDISKEELMSGRIISAGFPGADALFVNMELFDLSFESLNYSPWYLTPNNPNPLCIEEWWCLKALQSGKKIGLNTKIRTWHVHENGMAARWPGEYKHQEELCF